jgi:hypothetical protein
MRSSLDARFPSLQDCEPKQISFLNKFFSFRYSVTATQNGLTHWGASSWLKFQFYRLKVLLSPQVFLYYLENNLKKWEMWNDFRAYICIWVCSYVFAKTFKRRFAIIISKNVSYHVVSRSVDTPENNF